MPAYYLHDLNPVVLKLSSSLTLRWYGLSYVVGMCVAFLTVRALARRKLTEFRSDEVLVVMVLFGIGVMAGGKAGHVLLHHWSEFAGDPSHALRPSLRGMSSFGCIIGVTLISLCYAKWRGISWFGLLDAAACAFGQGVCLVRLGNFINGEHIGRVTRMPWGVKFPTELLRPDLAPAGGWSFQVPPGVSGSREIVRLFEKAGGTVAELAALLPARHPSQLYEAIFGGLLLFLVVLWARFRWRDLPKGSYAAMVCLGYAPVRIVVEMLREPEAGEALVWGVTRGQLYSIIFFVCGLALMMLSHRRRDKRA